MKKNYLLLLAGTAMLLTGCGGTKYTNTASSSGSNYSIETKQTLSLKNKEEGTGDFTLTTESNEEYADGYFKGVFGIGEVKGDVSYKVSGKETGSWSINDTTGIVTLTTYTVVMSIKISGDGAEDYKDICEPLLAVVYGEENAEKLVAGEKVTIEYENGYASYCKLDDEKQTFTAILG